MDSAFTYSATDVRAAHEWTDFQLDAWGVRTPWAQVWLTEAATRIAPGGTARVVLDYDPEEHVLSLDVWCDGARVYGIDDLV